MTKTFTRNDITRFLYGEMKEDEIHSFNLSLESDQELKKEYREQLSLLELIERSRLEPSEKTISRILKYSRDFTVSTELERS